MKKMDCLPLGSVVILKHRVEALMIIQRAILIKGKDEYFDYGGIPYPEGLTSQPVIYFNQKDLYKVLARGYTDESEIALAAQYHQAKKGLFESSSRRC